MAVYSVDPFDFQAPFPLDLRNRKGDIGGRNSIPGNARYPGMLVWTDNERVLWALDATAGTVSDNANWKQIYPLTGGGIQIVTWRNTPPTGGSNGDIAFVDDGATITVYFNQSGTWGALGSWAYGVGSVVSLLTLSTDPDPIDWQSDEAPDENGNPSGQTYAERFGNTFLWKATAELTIGPKAGKQGRTSTDIIETYVGGVLTQIEIVDVMPNTRITFK